MKTLALLFSLACVTAVAEDISYSCQYGEIRIDGECSDAGEGEVTFGTPPIPCLFGITAEGSCAIGPDGDVGVDGEISYTISDSLDLSGRCDDEGNVTASLIASIGTGGGLSIEYDAAADTYSCRVNFSDPNLGGTASCSLVPDGDDYNVQVRLTQAMCRDVTTGLTYTFDDVDDIFDLGNLSTDITFSRKTPKGRVSVTQELGLNGEGDFSFGVKANAELNY